MNKADSKNLPAPLLGCLYCHAEGTITETQPRKILGFGHEFPTLSCSNCHSVALFDAGATGVGWRIRYLRYNRAKIYSFSVLRLGKAGWLEADNALDISTAAYIQRQRFRQAERGDLSWLQPYTLSPPPPSFSVAEQVYMAFKYVTLHQEGHHSTEGQSSNGNMLDSGTFYVTDAKIYLMGRDRDWVYDFSKIRHVDFSNSSWKIDLEGKETPRYFKCESASNEVDPQLATAVINALRKHQL